jgi:hypothetical protein
MGLLCVVLKILTQDSGKQPCSSANLHSNNIRSHYATTEQKTRTLSEISLDATLRKEKSGMVVLAPIEF